MQANSYLENMPEPFKSLIEALFTEEQKELFKGLSHDGITIESMSTEMVMRVFSHYNMLPQNSKKGVDTNNMLQAMLLLLKYVIEQINKNHVGEAKIKNLNTTLKIISELPYVLNFSQLESDIQPIKQKIEEELYETKKLLNDSTPIRSADYMNKLYQLLLNKKFITQKVNSKVNSSQLLNPIFFCTTAQILWIGTHRSLFYMLYLLLKEKYEHEGMSILQIANKIFITNENKPFTKQNYSKFCVLNNDTNFTTGERWRVKEIFDALELP